MKIGGYAGQTLHIDLTHKKIQKESLDIEFIKNYIGGALMGCRLAYQKIKPQLDPFSSENVIIFCAGPMVGTNVPCSSKSIVITKCATGTVTYGTTGGFLGINLKKSGFDNLIVTGKADIPVYLRILNNNVDVCDATDLWGTDIFEVTDRLWSKYGRRSTIIATGPAGERRVKTTITLVDKINTLGKRGLGAIFGSKNLKAIVIHGTNKIQVSQPERLKSIVATIINRITSDPSFKKALLLGTMTGFDNWFKIQGSSCKNWTDKFPVEKAYQFFSPSIYLKSFKIRRVSDPTCPIGCKDHLIMTNGKNNGLETYISSFYGRLQNWASRCNVDDFNQVVKCQDYCNRTGLCTHSITALIDWAIYLYQQGTINKEDTGGLELRYDFETIMMLLEQAAHKEGFGGILSEGFESVIKTIGKNCEKHTIQIKGMEPLYDPRLNRLNTFDFHNITNPRGAHSATGSSTAYMVRGAPVKLFRQWAIRTGVPEEALSRIFPSKNYFNVARLTKWAEDWWILSNSLGINCLRSRVDKHFDITLYQELYNIITGFEITSQELRNLGEKAFNLLKMLNVREGYSRKDDVFPERWFEPLKIDDEERIIEDYFGNPLTKKDCSNLLDDYYDERRWNIKQGIPTKRILAAVGLNDICVN